MSRPKPERPDELTLMEVEVMKSAALGAENAEIAARLYISEKTVKNHIANIFSKLSIHSRYQLVVYAWKNQIVELT